MRLSEGVSSIKNKGKKKNWLKHKHNAHLGFMAPVRMGSRLRRRGQMCERGARSVASSDRWCTRCVNVNGFLSRLHLTKSIIMNGMNTICGAAINSRRESDQNLRGRFIQENVSVHFNGYRVSRRRQPRSLKAKNKN